MTTGKIIGLRGERLDTFSGVTRLYVMRFFPFIINVASAAMTSFVSPVTTMMTTGAPLTPHER